MPLSDLAVFVAIVVVVAVGGMRLGMLVAPGITRLADRDDEEPGDGPGPDPTDDDAAA